MNARIVQKLPGLTVIELSGSPREIGLAHGKAFAPEIALMKKRLTDYLSSISLGVGGRFLLWYFEKLAAKMVRYVPDELLDEMRGVAEGSGIVLNLLTGDVRLTLSSQRTTFLNFMIWRRLL